MIKILLNYDYLNRWYAWKESAKTCLELREINNSHVVNVFFSVLDGIGAFLEHKYNNPRTM